MGARVISEVWRRTDALVAELCRCPPMESHAWVMANWRSVHGDDPPRRALQESMLGPQYEARPLLLGFVMDFGDLGEALLSTPEGERWASQAVRVALGFGRIVEWIRSRMPRYPMLLVPQTDPRSDRCQPAGFFLGPGAPWHLPLRREGPQLLQHPDVSALDPPQGGLPLVEAVRALASGIQALDLWQELVDASRALTDEDVAILKQLKRQYRQEAADEVVDLVEPDNMLRRHTYREAVMQDVLASADRRPRRYLDAFAAADQLISAIVRLLEQGVVFGPPRVAASVAEGVWRDSPFGKRVRLLDRSHDALGFRPEVLIVQAELPELGGLLLGERFSVNLPDMRSEPTESLEGLLLPDSTAGLSAGPAWS